MTVRVLVVDDSPTARRALSRALTDTTLGVVVVGEASRASEALAEIDRLTPDLVTMDVHLGDEDGVALAALIMQTRPCPILVVTGVDPRDPGLAFRAVQAGALDVVAKPPGPNDASYESVRLRLVRLVRALAAVPVVTHRTPPPRAAHAAHRGHRPDLVVIGASTGGPSAVSALLAALPAPFPVPIAVVQHVSEGFGATLAQWLANTTHHRVFSATGVHDLAPGEVVLAPDNQHLVVVRPGRVEARDGPPRNFLRPCIDVTFESATVYGARVCAVVLTGMGRDGAEGLRSLRQAGAMTLAQEPATCVVDSMPVAAIALGGVVATLSVDRIAAALREAVA